MPKCNLQQRMTARGGRVNDYVTHLTRQQRAAVCLHLPHSGRRTKACHAGRRCTRPSARPPGDASGTTPTAVGPGPDEHRARCPAPEWRHELPIPAATQLCARQTGTPDLATWATRQPVHMRHLQSSMAPRVRTVRRGAGKHSQKHTRLPMSDRTCTAAAARRRMAATRR